MTIGKAFKKGGRNSSKSRSSPITFNPNKDKVEIALSLIKKYFFDLQVGKVIFSIQIR